MINKSYVACSVVIVFLAYYVLVCQNLYICDDFRYAFVQGTDEPVRGMGDAIRSQKHAYIYENGRFLVHVLVQCFSGIWGMGAMRLANAVFFTVLVFGIAHLVRYRLPHLTGVLPVVLVGLLFLMPCPGVALMGNMAMSVNYLWTASLNIVLIALLFHLQGRRGGMASHLAVLFFAVLVGHLQESFSIGIAVALLLHLLVNKPSRQGYALWLVAGYWIGCASVCLAPGNFLRLDMVQGDSSLVYRITQGCASVVVYTRLFPIMCGLLLLTLVCRRKEGLAFIRDNQIWVTAPIVNVMFIAFVAFTGRHQATCVELCSLIVLLRWLYGFILSRFPRMNAAIACLAVLVLLASYVPIYQVRAQVAEAYGALWKSAGVYGKGIVVSTDYDRLSYGNVGYMFRQFTSREYDQNFPLTGFSRVLTGGRDAGYMTTRLPQTPEGIKAVCRPNNEVAFHIYHQSGDCFYIVRLQQEEKGKFKGVNIIQQDNWLSSLRSCLFGGTPGIREYQAGWDELECYEHDGVNDYVVMDYAPLPIKSIVLVPRNTTEGEPRQTAPQLPQGTREPVTNPALKNQILLRLAPPEEVFCS